MNKSILPRASSIVVKINDLLDFDGIISLSGLALIAFQKISLKSIFEEILRQCGRILNGGFVLLFSSLSVVPWPLQQLVPLPGPDPMKKCQRRVR